MTDLEKFAEAVADYAVRNGFPITEDGFMSAMEAYVAHAKTATVKLSVSGGAKSPIIKPFFHIGAARAHFS